MTTVSGAPGATQPSAQGGAQQQAPKSGLARIAQLAIAGKKAEDEDENDKKVEDGDEDDDEKASEEEDDDEDKKDKKGKKAKKAEEDESAEEDSDEDDVDAKDGDDDSDDEDKKNAKTKAARRRERGRIAAILNCPAASRNQNSFQMAMQLAFKTSMTRGEAMAVLTGMPQVEDPAPTAKKDDLRSRMNTQPNPKVGPDANGGGQPNLAAQIIAAGKKRRGETD